jgi:YVTN family beta-propeller protein
MKHYVFTILFLISANLLLPHDFTRDMSATSTHGFLFIANQGDHTALLFNLDSKQIISKTGVDINGHEVAVSSDHRLGFVPIYGNSGVGSPGTDGSTIHVIDLRAGRTIRLIDLGKPVRPHCAKFAPNSMLYVSAELSNAIYEVDPVSGKLIAEIPTGAAQSHMFVLSPDGHHAYTSNVGEGSVSVLDLQKRSLITVIPVAKKVQRISISMDGHFVFTHDQDAPRIAVIDTASNKIARWITLPAPVYSSTPTPDGKFLIANAPSGKLFVIDLASDKIAASYPIPESIGEIAVDATSAHAYVSCPQKGTIEVLDISGGKLEAPIELTRGVDGLQWFPGIS